MKRLFRIFIACLIFFTIVFIGAYIFVRLNGKQMLTARLSAVFNREVHIGDVSVTYPLGLKIKDLNIIRYLYIKEVTVGFGVFYLVSNRLTFSSVVLEEPQIVIRKRKDAQIVIGDLLEQDEASSTGHSLATGFSQSSQEKTPEKKPMYFVIDRLIVRDGKASYIDEVAQGNPQVRIEEVQLRAKKVSFPSQPINTRFDLTASLVRWETNAPAGDLEIQGWFNLHSKDMKAHVSVVRLGGKIFPFWSTGDAGHSSLKNLVADLTADVESSNNDMTVKGQLTVKDIAFHREDKPEQDKSFPLEEMILGGLQSMAKEIVIDFSFKTKMDDFKIESISFSGNVFSQDFHREDTRRLADAF